MALIEIKRLHRSYDAEGGGRIHALREVSLEIEEGEFVCVTGPSGSGKSTLLSLLGCLDRASGGSYRLAGQEVGALSSDALAMLRRRAFGFVFQSSSLLETATTLENVALPACYLGMPRALRHKRARQLLERLGLADRAGNLPAELSGGEQQRAALARALMNSGSVILADEPASSLDSRNARKIVIALKEAAGRGHTVVLATHNADLAARAGRRIELLDGRVVSDSGADSNRQPRQGAKREGRPMARTAGALEAVRGGLVSLAMGFRRGSRLRVTMTALGIVFAVWLGGMALLLGEGAYVRVVQKVNQTGLETLTVLRTRKRGRDGNFSGLTPDDADAIKREVANVREVSPGHAYGPALINRGDISGEFLVYAFVDRGTKEGRGNVGYRLTAGEFITPQDDDNLRRVAVLDSIARDKFFSPDEDPVGQAIHVQGMPFRIKGVYDYRTGGTTRVEGESEESFFSREEALNNWIHVPFRTGYSLLAETPRILFISVFLDDPDKLFETADAIKDLGIRRYGEAVYFAEHPGLHLQHAKRLRSLLRYGLGAVAGIALLAMNLSVMSIMLMAVRSRRREIGVRMAVGARRRDILSQFLTEAAALSAAGSVLGAAAVAICVPVLNKLGYPVGFWPLAWIPGVIALLVGLAFGVLPAQRAARMNPVAALTSE